MLLKRVAEPFIREAKYASSERDLRSLMSDVVRELGFAHFALVHGPSFTSLDQRPNGPKLVKIDNYPDYWSERFTEDGLYRDDPVLHASPRAGRLFCWDELAKFMVMRPRNLAVLDAASRQGIGLGYTMPVQILGEPAGSCSFAMRPGVRLPELNGLCASIIGQYAFEAARRVSDLFRGPVRGVNLSPRQHDCVSLVCAGLSNKQIARKLGLSPETVKIYMSSAMRVLGVSDRASLAAKALAQGHVAYWG